MKLYVRWHNEIEVLVSWQQSHLRDGAHPQHSNSDRKTKIKRVIERTRLMSGHDRQKLLEILNEGYFWTLTVWKESGMLVAGCNQLIGGDPYKRVTAFDSGCSIERK